MSNASYICTKACQIGGESYKVDDLIKPGAIAVGRELNLIRLGLIAKTSLTAPVAESTPASPETDTQTDVTQQGDEQTGDQQEPVEGEVTEVKQDDAPVAESTPASPAAAGAKGKDKKVK